MKNLGKSKILKYNKGITLIALVVTIVILIILATVSINVIMGPNGLIGKAEQAREIHEESASREQGITNIVQGKIDDILGNTPITNPYESEEWEYAWTCTDGVWSELKDDAEGDIVAKFYKTGNKIKPTSIERGEVKLSFLEGDEYHLVIEGTGEMGPLVSFSGLPDFDTITGASAWQTLTLAYLMGQPVTPIIAYVTEVIVCDGITNVGTGAFVCGVSLNKATIGRNIERIDMAGFTFCVALPSVELSNHITSIGDSAFSYCMSFTNVTIPDSVTDLGQCAFSFCSNLNKMTIGNGVSAIQYQTFTQCNGLTQITLPENVVSIGKEAFINCPNLAKVKILTTSENIDIGSAAFNNLHEGSVIYVLTDVLKIKLEELRIH